jgi:ketosteroid isomerase-like protein
MASILRAASLAILTLVGAPSRGGAEGVRAALASLHAAGLSRDVAKLEALYAPEYFHTNADGSVMDRAGVLASYRVPARMSFSASRPDEEKLIVREGFAVVSERLSLDGKTAEGNPFTSRYRVTYVLERRDGAWRFLNSHASLLGIDKN